MSQILVCESPCNYCNESHSYFLDFKEDGRVLWDYQGCGGYMGRNAENKGKEVKIKEVIQRLKERKKELFERIQSSLYEIEWIDRQAASTLRLVHRKKKKGARIK